MRTLFTLGTIVTAVLVPWSSLAPSWLADTSNSATEANAETRPAVTAATARLNPTLGIAPLEAGGSDAAGRTASDAPSNNLGNAAFQGLTDLIGRQNASESSLDTNVELPTGVHCENGVCKLPDGTTVATSRLRTAPATKTPRQVSNKIDDLRARLESLGATQIRLDPDAAGDEFRCSCSVPLSLSSRFCRRFEAAAGSDVEAMSMLLAQVEEWRRERD